MNQYAPGLKVAITEYNWGADNHINGATTQADILGILGREGVDIATPNGPGRLAPNLQGVPDVPQLDGRKSGFGERSVQAAVPNPDQVSAFAALRNSDQA